MDLTTKNRNQLKQAFLNNKVPSQEDYAALIDASINQVDDRVARPAGQPLSIAAEGPGTNDQGLISFYGQLTDPNPIWSIKQRVSSAGNPGGMTFLTNGSSSALFLANDGRVGICTETPHAKLDIHSPNDYAVSIRRDSWPTGKHWEINTEGGAGSETLSFAWSDVNSRALIIKQDGRIGITEYDPRERVDVGRAGGPKAGIAVGDYMRLGETQYNNVAFMGINAWLSSSDVSGANRGIKFKPAWKGNGSTAGKGMVMAQSGGGLGDIDFYGIDWDNKDDAKDLYTQFTHVARFTNTGRFGVGTKNPGATVDVKGGMRIGSSDGNDSAWGAFNIVKREAGVNYAGLGFDNGSSASDNQINGLSITRQGRIGIGNTQPVALLDVWPSNDFAVSLRRQTWAGGRDFKINTEGGNGGEFLSFAWSNVNDRKLVIRSNGAIGIGSLNNPFRLNIGTSDGQNQLRLGANNVIRGRDLLNIIHFGNDGDYQLLHKASGVLGRSTLGLHCSSSDALGFYSSGWTPLFEVAGSTGHAYHRGNVGMGAGPDSSYRLQTASGDGNNQLRLGATTDYRGKDAAIMRFGTGGNYQFLHKASGVFGRNTLVTHAHSSDSIGFYSSGWTPLFEVAGGSGHAYFRERIGVATKPDYPLDIRNVGSGSWGRFSVTGTDLWSKGAGPYVTIGAGGATGIMFHNPHVVWQSNEARASIRYGRVNANTTPGGWWDVGLRSDSSWSANYQNGAAQFTVRHDGRVGIGRSPEGKLDVNGRLDVHTTRARFNGLHAETRRAQLVLSSDYSDFVIASSEINHNHGSTLTFASYNPSNADDFRKWVINQGNWGNRKHMLDFGYAEAGGRTNPHSNNNGTDSVMVLDGINKHVGIGSWSPSAQLALGEWNSGPSGRAVDGAAQLLLSGQHNRGVNLGTTGGTYKLKIEGYDNDGRVVYPIYVMDENNQVDFYLKNRPSAGGIPKLYTAAEIHAGNSDMYFTKTDHNHSAIGNTAGWAALENARNYDCLMILGRAGTGYGRRIRMWDHVTVQGTFWNHSDRRVKKDITGLSYGLKEVLKLKPVSFNWKDKPNPKKTIGLVAQEVEEVIDELVQDDTSESDLGKSVGYTALIPVLINAIKDLNKKVEDLETQLAGA